MSAVSSHIKQLAISQVMGSSRDLLTPMFRLSMSVVVIPGMYVVRQRLRQVLCVTPHSNILGMIKDSRTLILLLTIWTLLLIQSLAHVDGEEDCGVVDEYAPAPPHHTPCCRCWLCCGHSAETTLPAPSAHGGYRLSSWCPMWMITSLCMSVGVRMTDISKPNIEAGRTNQPSYL